MAADATGTPGTGVMSLAACTRLILAGDISGCTPLLQPDQPVASIKGHDLNHGSRAHMDAGAIGVFIPIVAIVMGIGIGMLAVWTEHKRKAQLLEQLHRERLQALDKGMELPPFPAHLVGDND